MTPPRAQTEEAGPASTAATDTAMAAAPVEPAAARSAWRRRWRWIGIGLAVLFIVGLTLGFLVPLIRTSLNTISTDDAYVNGHVTLVAPRVSGQVARVLVDDNMRVKRGQLLVELDREPYQIQANLKRAMLQIAQADERQAEAEVRSMEGTARSRRWKMQNTIEQVQNQVAALKAKVAVLQSRQATLDRARSDFTRAERLFNRGAISTEELDMRREAIRVAEAQVNEAQAQVHEARVSLGLPAEPADGKPLSDVPDDIAETHSAVRVAVADLAQTAAELGLPLFASEARPKQIVEDFRKLDTSGDFDVILRKLVKEAPTVKQAEAKVAQAQRELDQAQLDLKYCAITAEIDGVVTRRNVNPGNFVQVGQALMAVRSIQDVWIDANFKETQLADLRIGQRAEIYADMYGRRRVFRGRVSGFTMGTGATLALLPPQNATGNFVKVVQRLPVRIDLVDGNPEDAPLFIGLSVTPYVYYREPATGPHAGRRLQAFEPADEPARATR